ncbi:MAG: glycosyltransferase family 4 protein [Patescibacteria group bacterium]|nr:glycosyltransferase family 4 protein [Patescibacteria group bacterium]
MRIAQLVSSLYPVGSRSNQAIYSHVNALTDAFVKQGHETHLYAAGDSQTLGKLHSVTDSANDVRQLPADIQRYHIHSLISECYEKANSFDIIHSHFSLLSSFYARLTETPTVISIHSPIREEIKPFLLRYRNLNYVSFSHAQRLHMPELNWTANIYHGVDTELFGFNKFPQDYFLYLGRVTEDKGVHFAIEAAKAAGVNLVIAGRSYPTEGYWHKSIEPEINGKTIRYIGEADFEHKIDWLKNAKGLLFPTQFDETFGLVMIEAMSCGTPVIAWNKGSVPEVVQDKETGYIVDSVAGMVKAIKAIDKISRNATRQRAETFFSQQKMTTGYLKVYERIIAKSSKAKNRTRTKKK